MASLKLEFARDMRIRALKSLRDEGLTNKEIAQQLGVSENCIWHYLGPNKPDPCVCPIGSRKAIVEIKPNKVKEIFSHGRFDFTVFDKKCVSLGFNSDTGGVIHIGNGMKPAEIGELGYFLLQLADYMEG